MKNLSLDAIEKKLESYVFVEYSGSENQYRDTYEGFEAWDPEVETEVIVEDLGLVRTLEKTGCGDRESDGYGSESTVTLAVTDPATGAVRYFRKEGYYDSQAGEVWDGSFYEMVYILKPVLERL